LYSREQEFLKKNRLDEKETQETLDETWKRDVNHRTSAVGDRGVLFSRSSTRTTPRRWFANVSHSLQINPLATGGAVFKRSTPSAAAPEALRHAQRSNLHVQVTDTHRFSSSRARISRLDELDLGECDVGDNRECEGGAEETEVQHGGDVRGGENLLGDGRDHVGGARLGGGHHGTCEWRRAKRAVRQSAIFPIGAMPEGLRVETAGVARPRPEGSDRAVPRPAGEIENRPGSRDGSHARDPIRRAIARRARGRRRREPPIARSPLRARDREGDVPTASATGAAFLATSTRDTPALATTFTARAERRAPARARTGTALTAETRETWATAILMCVLSGDVR